MNKFHNKGTSFFEIVIAVAIFAMLMGPIVSKLIQAMKISENAKVAQNEYELAENLIENVKNSSDFMPTQVKSAAQSSTGLPEYTVDNVTSNDFLKQITDGAVTLHKGGSGNNIYAAKYSDGGKEAVWSGYAFTGTTKVGKKETPYYYAVTVDNKEYAKLEVEGALAENPNNMTLATIENLDASKLALINGTISNYDLTVTNAFMSQKLDILKVGDHSRWEQYTKQQADIVAFPNDTVTRVIDISVSSTGSGENIEYTVKCTLQYRENSSVILKDGIYAGKSMGDLLKPIEYNVYEKTFEKTLPHIYLMYNPCLYNNNYMAQDNIVIDTSGFEPGVDAADKTKIEVYVVETAEQFSEVAAKAYEEAYEEITGQKVSDVAKQYLINNKAMRDRADVQVNIIGGSNSPTDETDKFLTIYNNFNINPTTGMNKDPALSDDEAKNVYEANLLVKNRKNHNIVLTDVYPITGSTSSHYTLKTSQIKKLESAISSAAPLYTVKVYMSETPFTATNYTQLLSELENATVTISGTKGGN